MDHQIPCLDPDIPHQPVVVYETLVNGIKIRTWQCVLCKVEWRTR